MSIGWHGHLLLLLALAAALYALGRRWPRAWPAGVLLATPALLFAGYYLHLFDNAAWYYNLRALPYMEWTGAGLGFLAGALAGRMAPAGRVAIPAIALLLLLLPHLKPLLAPVDAARLQDNCQGIDCRQSTPSTCGPASAASLLRRLGKPATERELALEARTSTSGTEVWYLARALRAQGVDAVAMFVPDRIVAPSIAGVRLPGNAGHFIAILQQSPEGVTVMDPMHGLLVLPQTEIRKRYQFTGFYLETLPWR